VLSRGAQFEQALRCRLYADFDDVCSVFSEGIALSVHYIVLIFVARWRHNFREIAVKNCDKVQKSAEKFVRTSSYR